METLDKNDRSKLQNAVAELNWYAYRFLKISGFRIAHPVQGLEMARRVIGQKREIPPEIRQIVEWSTKLDSVTPENSEQIFKECWQFVHSFDDKLADYV